MLCVRDMNGGQLVLARSMMELLNRLALRARQGDLINCDGSALWR